MKKIIMILPLILISGIAYATPAPKVTICHATESGTNPYTRIVVSENAIFGHFDNPGTPKAGHEDDLYFTGEVDCPSKPEEPDDSQEPDVPEEPEEEPKGTPKQETTERIKVENTFHEDKRCHDITPPQATWFNVETGIVGDGKMMLTWSATDGDKIEVRFGTDPDNLEWSFITENDGHEEVGYEHNSGKLWNGVHYWWQIRTLNGCEKGAWSDKVDPLP